jgi:hypothetical protein
MTTKIDKKIISYKVVTEEKQPEQANDSAPEYDVESMHEKMERPEMLLGSTYKIKTPQSDHALYITINDMVLNADTAYEERRPYEIFINSKNMEHYQWVTALTRVISAIFRKSGDITFLVEELKGIFDPKGGYFKKGGVFMPSLVAEIGCAIEMHMRVCGMIKNEEMDENQKQFLAAKRKEFEARHNDTASIDEEGVFPAQAVLCNKCNTKALVLMDGCMTCLNCGDSKCG